MEVCVESIESALNAFEAGAIRLELCSALSEGGLTPSYGLFKTIKKLLNIPVYVMLRPRAGHFVYSALEMKAVQDDAHLFLSAGADGFVFGALTEAGHVDGHACKELMSVVGDIPVTFHRAFDWTVKPFEALEDIISLGFKRILTSGFKDTAFHGKDMIGRLIGRAQHRIIIMPGAGINEENIKSIAAIPGVVEFHASARQRIATNIHRNTECNMGSQDSESCVTSVVAAQKLIRIFNETRKASRSYSETFQSDIDSKNIPVVDD